MFEWDCLSQRKKFALPAQFMFYPDDYPLTLMSSCHCQLPEIVECMVLHGSYMANRSCSVRQIWMYIHSIILALHGCNGQYHCPLQEAG